MSGNSTPGTKRGINEVNNDGDSPNFDDPMDLVNAVVSSLQCPEEKTNVAMNYSNEKNIATEVQAYAKIAGANWTFYVKSLAISIGRNTDNNGNSTNMGHQSSQGNQNIIDIDLGPAKVVSRQHATITYNLDLRCWELKILGRNGAKVDGHKVSVDSSPTPLHSGAILDIGGTQMMFILPGSAPNIDKRMMDLCLSRYKLNYHKAKKSTPLSYFPQHHTLVPHNNKTFQMFEKSHLNHSPSQLSASSLQSNLDQDLSREDAKDIKPPYSYATMITQAILSNDDGVMSLSEIYDWIAAHYAYYKYSKTGWQNSIRHNLSLNKAFEKVPRRPNEPGKGMKWQISEGYKDEFLNKISNGSLLKARRGSSVSRQLQLHLATHQGLPESSKYYLKEEMSSHSRNSSFGKFTQPIHYNPGQDNNSLQFYPMQNNMANHNNNNNNNNNNNSFMSNRPMDFSQTQQNPPPQLLYNMPPQQNQNLSNLPDSNHNKNNGFSSPIRHLNDIAGSNTPKLPKVNGSNLYNLPPPPSSHSVGLSAPSNHSRLNSYNVPMNELNNSSSYNNNTSDGNSNVASMQTNTTSDLALGFASPKKVSQLEAFTPERGSKSMGNKLGIPTGLNTNQSSPAFWNFVQFSTPNGQTPMRKGSDELNGEGSPTLNRKLMNDSDKKNLSPLRSNDKNEGLHGKRASTESA